MIDLLLSITHLVLSMGLDPMDEHLQKVISATDAWTPPALSQITAFAKVLGAGLALCMAAYEAYMMILARRGLDVLKILRIVGLGMCITWSGWIADVLRIPGNAMYTTAQGQMALQNTVVAERVKACAEAQQDYTNALREKIDTLTEKQIQRIMDEAQNEATGSWTDRLTIPIVTAWEEMKGEIKKMMVSTETLVAEVANEILRFLGEVIFQLAFFGLLLTQKFMLGVLKAFCPIAFALSIVPPWASAWSQWISKYVSISLWGFLVCICVCYVDFILLYEINLDITAYENLKESPLSGSLGEIGMLGLQQIGATCRVVMAYVIGAIVMKFVPEIASWLIPGGASSSIGSAMGGLASTAVISSATFAGGKAWSVTKSVAGGGSSAAGAAGGAVVGATVQGAKGAASGAQAGVSAARGMGGSGSVMGALGTSMFAIAGAAGGLAEGAARGAASGGAVGYRGAKKTVDRIRGKK